MTIQTEISNYGSNRPTAVAMHFEVITFSGQSLAFLRSKNQDWTVDKKVDISAECQGA
jgi:hypothetical protein